jgi:D-tyrosyl-tRNA(Tyr) deacylase
MVARVFRRGNKAQVAKFLRIGCRGHSSAKCLFFLPPEDEFGVSYPMRAVIQRVRSARVAVNGETVGAIDHGLLVLLGVETADTAEDVEWLSGKIISQRLFPDAGGAWALSVRETGGEILVVSQFTLHASTRKGTKPSWHRAAKPEQAIPLFDAMVQQLETLLGRPVATGQFGAMMDVTLVNDGPVTLLIDSKTRE